MTGFSILTTTVATAEEAKVLARVLVEARLAACVQILPVVSVYRWEGAVEDAQEHLLLCKIASADFGKAQEALRERHSYDLPEIVAMPISDGDTHYLAWLRASTKR